MNSSNFRWGIIGLGSIARHFAESIPYAQGATLLAVGSRSQEKADQFASRHNAERAYGSYEELTRDPEVDAVYIATPNSEHWNGARLCIERGKPILLEKPFTINAREARDIIDLAKSSGVFCMEAMWTRFLPAVRTANDLIRSGAIGEVRLLQAALANRAVFDPKSRLFDPKLGGGALLDIGIYAISLSSMILGKPDIVQGFDLKAKTGVDDFCTFILRYKEAIAQLAVGFRFDMPRDALIYGDCGSIRILGPWWQAQSLAVSADGRQEEVIEKRYPGPGYQFEADEVKRCVTTGLLESGSLPLKETLYKMDMMDELRRGWGIAYAADGEDALFDRTAKIP